MLELFFNPLDLLPRRGTLQFGEIRRLRAGQTTVGAVHDRGDHLQIADQVGAGSRRRLWLPLAFEKQRRIVQDALANRG